MKCITPYLELDEMLPRVRARRRYENSAAVHTLTKGVLSIFGLGIILTVFYQCFQKGGSYARD